MGWLAGCSGNVKSTNTVDITADGFEPKNIRVALRNAPEGKVIWKNVDDQEHSVVSASDNWDFESERLGPEEAVVNDFTSSGVYSAVCGVHNDPADVAENGELMKIAIGADASIDDPV